MGERTAIQWTDATWNPWQGCTPATPGCDHCYAARQAKRLNRDFSLLHRSADATFNTPLRWQMASNRARLAGQPRSPLKVFTCSVSDFFHRDADPWREEAWEIMGQTPDLVYQVLTKRPGRMLWWARTRGWLPNVWAGVSISGPRHLPWLDLLAQVPAPVRFVSAEPLLEALDLRPWLEPVFVPSRTPGMCDRAIDWVIVGGESGPGARPFDLRWAIQVIDQCRAAGVPVFVKQIGANPWTCCDFGGCEGHPCRELLELRDRKGGDWDEWPEGLRVREMPDVLAVAR